MKKMWKVILVIVVVLAVVLIGGFTYLYNNGLSGQYANTEAEEGQIKVACVGDSITYGHGVSGWEENNYPAVLQEILGEEYHVANFGSSGACVNPNGDQPYISREVYQDSLDYEADILVFMLGTNDSKPENWTDAETFLVQHKELLNSYMQSENPPMVYVGLCAESFYVDGKTEGVTEYDIQPAVVDEIVENLKQMYRITDYPVKVIDIHTLTETHPEWFEKDGVHPNNDGAKAIAEIVAEAIVAE